MMKKGIVLAATVLCVGAALAAESANLQAVAWTAESMKWTELPNRPGAAKALLWGDEASPHGEIIRFPANTKVALHTHSVPLRIVVLSGTFTYGTNGDAERPYGPGSFIQIPAGLPHSNGCSDGCSILHEPDGKFDSKPAAPPTARAREG